MNNTRRKAVRYALAQLEEVRSMMETVRDLVDNIVQEEDEAFLNIPESLQGTDRYEKSASALDELNFAFEILDEACSSLEDCATSLETAIE